MKKYSYQLKNLDCANCAAKLEAVLQNQEYLQDVVVNFNTLKLSYRSEAEHKEEILEIIQQIEPDICFLDKNESKTLPYFDIIKFIVGLIFIAIAMFIPEPFSTFSILIAYIILLSRTFMNAMNLLVKRKSINENFLVFISCIGAYCLGQQMEGLMVIILYEIGKMLEDRAIHKTRSSIQELMDLQPEYANLKRGDSLVIVSPEVVQIGDIIIVKKGEKVPLDGMIIKGSSNLDVKALTGESKYKAVKIGEDILSGSVNMTKVLEVKVTKTYENSTVSRILELVENATDRKAKTETFVSRWARIYTPIVILLAVLVAIFMPLLFSVSYEQSIYKALTFLVISCPCAIAISVPLSYFSGIGSSSKHGILVKGSDYLDHLRSIREIVFDKTGTLTKGNFTVSRICSLHKNYDEEDILLQIAKGEKFSNHPIGISLLHAVNSSLEVDNIGGFQEISGQGIMYKEGNRQYLIGSAQFVGCEEMNHQGTTIYLKENKRVIGYVVLEDCVKEEALEVISRLHSMGIQTRMFTGDEENIAYGVAEKLGLDNYQAQMLPDDKYRALDLLIHKKKEDEQIAFVGDGINDAPVLAEADIGISMGGIGSASAIEASDVVIMNDDLRKIPLAIEISKFTNYIIKQNLVFAIGIKVLVLILSLFGFATMWQAVFADVGVTVITILNTLRILNKSYCNDC